MNVATTPGDHMTQEKALEALIEAVEAGTATEFQFHTWRPGLSGTIKESKAMLRAYNGSLDAAAALHDALLPGWDWEICNDTADKMAAVWPIKQPKNVFDGDPGYGHWPTPARAWLLAILRALAATRTDTPPGAAG